ncbi:MAG: succinate dehydrogenase, cytochrome b556 subunit [Gammaproteobacteria bacterium]
MNHNRPLSPHLQVYKLPLTGILSITHRMTGVMLALGLVLFVYILTAVAAGAESYTSMQNLMGQTVSRLLYWAFIYAMFFHLCHGVRHLIWDSGGGFDIATMTRYALFEVFASLILTLATFFLV